VRPRAFGTLDDADERSCGEHGRPVDVVAERSTKVPDARSAVIGVVVMVMVMVMVVVVVIMIIVPINVVLMLLSLSGLGMPMNCFVLLGAIILREVDDRVADVYVIVAMEGVVQRRRYDGAATIKKDRSDSHR
jgi:hypothetical protein